MWSSTHGKVSHSLKKVGRMCTVGTPDQSSTRSAIQWSRAAWLLLSSRAEICDISITTSTPARRAASAK
jgi:hypothetical protein